MKTNVKYPSPHKKNLSTYYRNYNQMPSKNPHKLSLLMQILIFCGVLIFFFGSYNIIYSLFIKSSVQGVFNGILFSLTGAILVYIFSHDRFIAKKQSHLGMN